MFKKYIIKIVGLLLLAQSWAFAQQDPQYTQYMYNMSVVNPAYTTNDLGRLNFGGGGCMGNQYGQTCSQEMRPHRSTCIWRIFFQRLFNSTR